MDDKNNLIFNNQSTVSRNLNSQTISWTASEFVDNSKGFMWYLGFMLSILAIGAIIYWLTKSYLSSIAIVIMGAALCYMGARKPREISYSLDSNGINIDNIHYPFELFRSYSIVTEGGISHINLISIKRFSPVRNIYFEPSDRDKILNHLGTYLPLENSPTDPIDKFMKKIRL